jgi:hypothetical protein
MLIFFRVLYLERAFEFFSTLTMMHLILPSLTHTNLSYEFNTFLIPFGNSPYLLHLSFFAHHPLALIGHHPWTRKNFLVQILYIYQAHYEYRNSNNTYQISGSVVRVESWWNKSQLLHKFDPKNYRISNIVKTLVLRFCNLRNYLQPGVINRGWFLPLKN